MGTSLPHPSPVDKHRAADEVTLRLRAADKARELIDPDDPRGAAAIARLRRWAYWRFMADNHGIPRDDAP